MSEWLTIVVESTSPALQYDGDWISAGPSSDVMNITKFSRYPFSQKLCTVPEGKKGSIFYKFTDTTTLVAQGTLDTHSPYSLDVPPTFDIHCHIESLEPSRPRIETFTLSGNATENLYTFCDVRNLSPTISYTVNFTVEAFQGQPVLFDRLLLTPTPSTKIDGLTTIMDHRHLMIQYDYGAWQDLTGAAHVTNVTQAKMRLNFTGTSLRWYTAWQPSWGTIASDASWQIDNLPFQRFTIPAIPPRLTDDVVLEELLFKTPDLSPGQHHLEVTYDGTENTRPLALRSLVIEDTLPSTSVNPSPSPSFADGPSKSQLPRVDDEGNGLSQSAKIAIGVSTAVAGLLVLGALLFLLYRRRRNAERYSKSAPAQGDSLVTSVSPYPLGPSSVPTPHSVPTMSSAPSYRHEPPSPLLSPSKEMSTPRPPITDLSEAASQEEYPPPYYDASGSSNIGCFSDSGSMRRKV